MRRAAWLSLCLLITFAAPGARADQRFTWRYHPDREQAMAPVLARADATLAELAAQLDVPLPEHVVVDVAEDLEAFRDGQRRPPGAEGIDWAVGIAYADEGRILLRVDQTHLFTLEETFRHELSHLLLLTGVPRRAFPRWFSEGVAILQSGQPLMDRLRPALDAATTGRLIPVDLLGDSFPGEGPALHLAYAQSGLFVRWLIGHHGEDALRALVADVRAGRRFDAGFEARMGASVGERFGAWRAVLEKSASWWRVLADDMLLWGLVTLLFIVAGFTARRRSRRRLEQMERNELARLIRPGPLDHRPGPRLLR